MADYKLDDDVRDVLSRAMAEGLAIFLPKGQLDRKLYERVNKALTNAGGKWNRQTGAHLFKSDAGPKLAAMLGTGVSVDEKKRDQSFFTHLASLLSRLQHWQKSRAMTCLNRRRVRVR